MSQNVISPNPKLIESQVIAQTIDNDQVYVGSKRKFCANINNKLTKTTNCKFTFIYKSNIKYANNMRNKTNFQ